MKSQHDMISSLWEEVEYFNDTFIGAPITPWMPQTNIREQDEYYELDMAIPGFNKEDIRVSVKNDVLAVEGIHKEESQKMAGHFMRQEFETASFQRLFKLPQEVYNHHVDATYENGILKIILMKNKESRQIGPKEVKIS